MPSRASLGSLARKFDRKICHFSKSLRLVMKCPIFVAPLIGRIPKAGIGETRWQGLAAVFAEEWL
jgi:hypothetical protein